MTPDERKLVDIFGWTLDRLEKADRITLADAEGIAFLARQVKGIGRHGRDAEELALENLAYRTEQLLVDLVLLESNAEPAVKGDVTADLTEWQAARRELLELRLAAN